MSEEPEGMEEDSPAPSGAPAWMATFGDMMSLLLTFFVLLLSFANMDIVKFQAMLGSVQDALGTPVPTPGPYAVRSTLPIELSDRESSPRVDPFSLNSGGPGTQSAPPPQVDQAMLGDMKRIIVDQNLEKVVDVEAGKRGVTLRVKGQLLFAPGSATLRPESYVFLDEIVKVTKTSPYRLSIEGHSDDRPIRTTQFPTNWHLSSARAIAALRYFTEVGGIDPKRVSCTGYADTHPLVPNDTRQHRAENRRVEFVYYRGDRGESEPSPPSGG